MTRTTIEQLRENFSYDPESGVLTRIKHVSGKFKIGDTVGTVSSEGYLTVYVLQEKLHVHRIAWALFYGEWPAKSLDHEDRNKTNNRIVNLRLATNSQNIGNTLARSKSGFKGVAMLPHGRFQAKITISGKGVHIGTFDTADEAGHAYNKKAIEYFGDFAVLNPVGICCYAAAQNNKEA